MSRRIVPGLARDRREDPHERRVVADAPAVTATRGAAWT